MSDIKSQPYTPEELHEEANANGRIVGENTAFVNKYRLSPLPSPIPFSKDYCSIFDPTGSWIGGSNEPEEMIDILLRRRMS